ncbi:GNAT family N-acetyltransferase [Gracilibacillus marinus]|jgi:ribosomal-protein-serine acetyltransferase|uniref:GNAT family N-acetyltransferase n=1 Tax=Gracilibacillus marinus TaxID=630535 RepID=A0ABV8VZ01_9BACI
MDILKIDEELSLRQIELADAKEVFELTDHSRDYLKEWLPWLDTTLQVKDTKEFIKICVKGAEENKSLNTVILFKGEIVGVAGFNSINKANNTAYIGYWLGKDYQGNGIMTRVVKALTNYAFAELHLNKVEIWAAVENKKSRNIPERLHFVEEGCIRSAEWLYDHYIDSVVYGMLASEWNG